MKLENLKSGLISGVLGSTLFFVIFQPLLEKLSTLAINVVSLFVRNYSDSIYLSAATKNTELISTNILLFFFTLTIGIIIGTVSYLVTNFAQTTKDIKELDTKLVSNSNELPSRGKYEQSIEVRMNNLAKFQKKVKLFGIITVLLLTIFILSQYISLYKDVTSVRIIYEFEQQLAVLSPYIDTSQLGQLNHQWALMETKSDYELIKSTLDSIAHSKNIELPN